MTDYPERAVVPGIKIGSKNVFSLPPPLPFYLQAMGDHTFWFTCFLATVILLLPVVAWRFYRADVSPTLTDRARLRQRTDRKAKPKPEFRPFSGRRSRSASQWEGQNMYRVTPEDGKNLLLTSDVHCDCAVGWY